jgi:hypothetical protein
MTRSLAAACDLIERGLAVTPVPAGAREPGPGWLARATTQVADLQAWPHDVGVAVACRPSGVVVLDLDRHGGVDGVERLRWLSAAAGGRVPDTFVVDTPHGGQHLYFRPPPDTVVLSASGLRSPLGAGIDVRAPGRRTGGYVLAPGTHIAAGKYTIASDAPIATLPTWLTRALARSNNHRPRLPERTKT